MSLNYYVYYRIVPAEAARVRAIVLAVQSALERTTGIAGSLLQRSDDASTWMEVYDNIDQLQAFESALEHLLAEHGFAGCLAPGSSRRVERFTACA